MFKNNFVTVCFKSISFFFLCSGLSAAPVIYSAQKESLQNGATVTVAGNGFSVMQTQVSPVLFDFSDETYENGKLNLIQQSYTDGQPIPRVGETATDGIWAKPSIGTTSYTSTPVLVRSRSPRNKWSNAHYLMAKANSFLGWPMAYGGKDTPVDNTKLYAAWYLKMKYDPRYYWGVSPQSMSGAFSSGEPVSVNGIKGTFLGIGTGGIGEGMLEFEFEGQLNSRNLIGQKIVGARSGAHTIFPSSFASGTGVGYEPPGANKYIRVWEDPNGMEGTRISWTQMQVHGAWHWAPVTPGKWHLMEFFLDTKSQEMKAYVDRELIATVPTDDTPAISGKWSPTIALLGFNGKLQEYQEAEIDDIYMDSKFSRVALGTQDKFSNLENYELQLPVSWSSDKIQFKLNLGSIDPNQPFYLYIIDENGQVNEEGFPMCVGCKVPPSSVPLKIN